MKKFGKLSVRAVLLLAVLQSSFAAQWTVEGFLGTAWSLPTPLSIHQVGEERIYLTARYSTKPLKESPYYAWRIAKWRGSRAWEIELVHHKIYLNNPPDVVQHFEISHGYNLITINRSWPWRGFICRVGAGMVVTHPETTIRGKRLPWSKGLDGFYISGPTAQFGLQKKFSVWGGLFAVLEGKFTASYAVAPVQDGNAYVPNVALHALFGLGYRL